MTDKPQWRTEGDTEVCEWRGMRAEIDQTDAFHYETAVMLDGESVDFTLSDSHMSTSKHCAESLMLLHAERDRLRKRVEVLQEIAKIRQYGSFITEAESVKSDELYRRLAELDKDDHAQHRTS